MSLPWSSMLLDLTIRGAIITGLVAGIDLVMGRWLSARHRRRVWLVAPLAYLVPCWLRLPVLPAVGTLSRKIAPLAWPGWPLSNIGDGPATGSQAIFEPLAFVWVFGMLVGSFVVALRTFHASRLWGRHRFSTDSDLLKMVEDCRVLARVHMPVGVVVSEGIASPALLGWLRPKLLLPADWLNRCPETQIRDVLLHEIAHLRAADLAWSWLFTAARVIHWFNPLAHVAVSRWHAVREDAADEFVLESRAAGLSSYAETLLAFLKEGHRLQPFGALGMSENFHNLKHRIQMIQNHPRRVVPALFTGLLIATLACAAFLRQARAEASNAESKAAAVAAMNTWLKGIDEGGYAKSWLDASETFQKAVTQDQWIAALKQVRTPLGACGKRVLASAMLQNGAPLPGGKTLPGEFVIAQFKTSFANLFSAIETVTFERGSDGVWRASGYFIKPA